MKHRLTPAGSLMRPKKENIVGWAHVKAVPFVCPFPGFTSALDRLDDIRVVVSATTSYEKERRVI